MVRAPPRSCAKRPVGAATVTRARGDPQGFRPRALRPRCGRNRVTGPLEAGTRLRTVVVAGEEHGERRSARSSRSRRVLPRRETSRTGRSATARQLERLGTRVETTSAPDDRSRRPVERRPTPQVCQSRHRAETTVAASGPGRRRSASRGAGSRRLPPLQDPVGEDCQSRGLRDVGTRRLPIRGRDDGDARPRGGVGASADHRGRNCERLAGRASRVEAEVRIEPPISGRTARAASCRRRGWPRRPGGPARPRARRRSR